MKITEIFEKKGEPYFRDMETEAIRRASSNDKAVIASGGGAVLRPENLELLEKNATLTEAAPAK